jgi:hypothetical protein
MNGITIAAAQASFWLKVSTMSAAILIYARHTNDADYGRSRHVQSCRYSRSETASLLRLSRGGAFRLL